MPQPNHAEPDPPGAATDVEGKGGADGFNAGFTGTFGGGGLVPRGRGYADSVEGDKVE